MVAGTGGGFRAQLPPHCPALSGTAGLPAGEAGGQRPGRCPSCQAGRPTAPQQGPQGPPLRVSVSMAPTPVTSLVPPAEDVYLSTHPKGLSFSLPASKVKATRLGLLALT